MLRMNLRSSVLGSPFMGQDMSDIMLSIGMNIGSSVLGVSLKALMTIQSHLEKISSCGEEQ